MIDLRPPLSKRYATFSGHETWTGPSHDREPLVENLTATSVAGAVSSFLERFVDARKLLRHRLDRLRALAQRAAPTLAGFTWLVRTRPRVSSSRSRPVTKTDEQRLDGMDAFLRCRDNGDEDDEDDRGSARSYNHGDRDYLLGLFLDSTNQKRAIMNPIAFGTRGPREALRTVILDGPARHDGPAVNIRCLYDHSARTSPEDTSAPHFLRQRVLGHVSFQGEP